MPALASSFHEPFQFRVPEKVLTAASLVYFVYGQKLVTDSVLLFMEQSKIEDKSKQQAKSNVKSQQSI